VARPLRPRRRRVDHDRPPVSIHASLPSASLQYRSRLTRASSSTPPFASTSSLATITQARSMSDTVARGNRPGRRRCGRRRGPRARLPGTASPPAVRPTSAGPLCDRARQHPGALEVAVGELRDTVRPAPSRSTYRNRHRGSPAPLVLVPAPDAAVPPTRSLIARDHEGGLAGPVPRTGRATRSGSLRMSGRPPSRTGARRREVHRAARHRARMPSRLPPPDPRANLGGERFGREVLRQDCDGDSPLVRLEWRNGGVVRSQQPSPIALKNALYLVGTVSTPVADLDERNPSRTPPSPAPRAYRKTSSHRLGWDSRLPPSIRRQPGPRKAPVRDSDGEHTSRPRAPRRWAHRPRQRQRGASGRPRRDRVPAARPPARAAPRSTRRAT